MIRWLDNNVLIDRRLSQYLNGLKGPRLSVLLCLALHGNEDRESRVGLSQISAETGYVQTTVSRTLRELYLLNVDGATAVTLSSPAKSGQEQD